MSAQRPPLGAQRDEAGGARLALFTAKLAQYRVRGGTTAAADTASAAQTVTVPMATDSGTAGTGRGTVSGAAKKRKVVVAVRMCDSSSDDDDDDDDDEYDAEAITGVRLVNGATQYLYARRHVQRRKVHVMN